MIRSDDLYEMHALIDGRVQGVGFRFMTCRHAIEYGLKGTVKNLSDGRVEIYAQGPKSLLLQFIQTLKNKIDSDFIKKVDIEYSSVQTLFSDFKIIY